VADTSHWATPCAAFSSYDLKAAGKYNSLIKFADDCTLLVPADTDVSAEDELANIFCLE